STGTRRRSVPAVGLPELPGRLRTAVPVLDVAQSPADLGGGVGLPVGAGGGHLVARQRLRDAVRAGSRVVRLVVPPTLAAPERVQRRHLVQAEPELGEQCAPDRPVAGVLLAVL